MYVVHVRVTSIEVYLATCLSRLTDTSGIPHTSCSNLSAVYRDSIGTGMIDAIPSLTAAACMVNNHT